MTNNSLFVLADEYRQAAETMADLDLDDQTIADTLEGLAGNLEVKGTNVAMFVRNLESMADAIKDAENKMAARRKAIENRAKRVRDYLLQGMSHAGINKIECPYFSISIKNNPPSVVVEDEKAIPAEFMRQPEPPPPSPDKKAIAEAIKSGRDVPGARLNSGTRLDIK